MGEGTSSPPPRSSNSDAASAAIHGLGGVGKSVLAQEYGWRNRERYRGVWWLRAEQPQTLIDDLIALGSRLMPGVAEIPEKDRAVHLVLDAIANTATDKPWLLIYDNAESPAAIGKLTPAGGAHLIVTSRWSNWHDHGAQELPVDVFPPEVAADYLMEHARHPDREAAARLAEALGYLPLALSHARATCWASNLDFDSYRARLPELIRKAPRGAAYPRAVYATFDLAIGKAAALCPQAERLMEVAAFLAPDRIPVDLITDDIMSASERDDSLAALAELSLITHETLDDGSRGFSVHRLVQEVTRARLGERADEITIRALKLVLAAIPKGNAAGEHTEWPRIEKVLPHALSILRRAPNEAEHAEDVGLLNTLIGFYLNSRGAYGEAEPLYIRALAIAETALGPDHPDVAIHLNNLAALLQTTNRLADAEPLMRRALAIDEDALGPDHPRVAIDLNNLAALLQANRFAEAEPLMRRALTIDEDAHGPDDPRVAIDLNNLAQLLQDTGRLAEAEPLMKRALQIDEAAFGPDHPHVAIRLNNLALLYHDTNRLAEAEPLYERAVAIFETSLGPDHPNTKTARENYEIFKAERPQ